MIIMILMWKECILYERKRLDAKNRWRNVVVAFRMSPEGCLEWPFKAGLYHSMSAET